MKNHQQLLSLKNFISKLANKLQRKLLAKQNRSWDFDLEEGTLDTSKLTRIIIDPLNSLSFKKEKDIHSLFSLAISEENVELELIFGHSVNNTPINKTIFIKLLEVLKQNYSYIGETNNLDIKCAHNKGLSNIRCTIKDLDSIKKYCTTNSLDDIDNLDFVEKSPYRKDRFLNTNIKNTDYNVRLNLKVEEDLNYSKQQKLQYSGNHDSKDKYYRYKKRYSFETQDNLFRIDLTVVKSTQFNLKNKTYNLTRSFKEANILNNPETYELEIEFIGRDNSFNDDFDFRAVERMGYSRILKDIEGYLRILKDVCSLSKIAFSVSPSPREPFLREPPHRKPPLMGLGSKGSVLSIHGALYEEVVYLNVHRSRI